MEKHHSIAGALAGCLLLSMLLSAAAHATKSDEDDMVPRNPYEGDEYAGCEGGFCPSQNADIERAFWKAAADDNVEELKALLANPALNTTRNIVPDDQGHARVIDVAVWAATTRGNINVMKVLLSSGGLDTSEHGHMVDLAAKVGDVELLKLLLDHKYTIGGHALAYAAKFDKMDMMKALLESGQQLDLKSAMQAAATVNNTDVLQLLVDAGAMKEIRHPVTGKEQVHDWRADYAGTAVAAGNVVVLDLLFKAGWRMRWQSVEGLVKAAAYQGSPDVMRALFRHPAISEDDEELEEAVATALKGAAERGHTALVDMLVGGYPEQAKKACVGALLLATKYARIPTVSALTQLCNASSSSIKYQEAGWQGQVLLAASRNHLTALNLLLQHPQASALLGKLYSGRQASSESQGPPPPLPLDQDPLMSAAAAGHKGVVEALLKYGMVLCAPCAAVEAAAAGHLEIFKMLVEGPAGQMLQAEEELIQDALRATALAMQGGHWTIVEWLMSAHQSPALGPYFLPAIAQQNKLEDMNTMMGLISKHGMGNMQYLMEQIYSSSITAALQGQLEMLHLLQTTPLAAMTF